MLTTFHYNRTRSTYYEWSFCQQRKNWINSLNASILYSHQFPFHFRCKCTKIIKKPLVLCVHFFIYSNFLVEQSIWFISWIYYILFLPKQNVQTNTKYIESRNTFCTIYSTSFSTILFFSLWNAFLSKLEIMHTCTQSNFMKRY